MLIESVLKSAATAAGITQKQMAAAAGMAQPELSKKCSRRTLRADDIVKLLAAAGYELYAVSKTDRIRLTAPALAPDKDQDK